MNLIFDIGARAGLEKTAAGLLRAVSRALPGSAKRLAAREAGVASRLGAARTAEGADLTARINAARVQNIRARGKEGLLNRLRAQPPTTPPVVTPPPAVPGPKKPFWTTGRVAKALVPVAGVSALVGGAGRQIPAGLQQHNVGLGTVPSPM